MYNANADFYAFGLFIGCVRCPRMGLASREIFGEACSSRATSWYGQRIDWIYTRLIYPCRSRAHTVGGTAPTVLFALLDGSKDLAANSSRESVVRLVTSQTSYCVI